MCGLFGILSFTGSGLKDKKEVLWQGLYMSAFRGVDGTGVALIKDANSAPSIYKKALPSWDFLQLRTVDKIMNNLDRYQVILGHTRSSTRGETSDENAHPFVHGDITLIHNGVVHNHRQLTGEHTFQVDSEGMCYALSTHEDTKALLEKVDGDYVFVWHDRKKGTFNIARNDGRPLWWAYTNIGLIFASEMGMLAYVLRRADIKIKDNYWYPAINKWYSWKLSDKDIEKFDQVPFSPSPRSTAVATTGSKTVTGVASSTTGTANKGSAVPLHTALFNIREMLTKQRTKYKPITEKQKKKAERRLKDYGIVTDALYSFRNAVFMPYRGSANNTDSEQGFLVASQLTTKARVTGAIIHNFTRKKFTELKGDMAEGEFVFFRAIDTYGVKQGGTVLIAELADNWIEPTSNQQFVLAKDEEDENDLVPGPRNEWIPLSEWAGLVEAGCSMCHGFCNPDHAGEMMWVGPDNKDPVCHECANDPNNEEILLGDFIDDARQHYNP